jgi:hypothetical protein
MHYFYPSKKNKDDYRYAPYRGLELYQEFPGDTECKMYWSRFYFRGNLFANGRTNLFFCQKNASGEFDLNLKHDIRYLFTKIDPSNVNAGEIESLICKFKVQYDFGSRKRTSDYEIVYIPP